MSSQQRIRSVHILVTALNELTSSDLSFDQNTALSEFNLFQDRRAMHLITGCIRIYPAMMRGSKRSLPAARSNGIIVLCPL